MTVRACDTEDGTSSRVMSCAVCRENLSKIEVTVNLLPNSSVILGANLLTALGASSLAR